MAYERAFAERAPTDIGRLDLSALIEGAVFPTGFTDRASNAIALHGPDPFSMIESQGAADDDAFLKLFLHEVTHHSSFAHALGWALSSLSVSCVAHRDDSRDNGPVLSLPARDLIVDRYLYTLMGPLIEGTALFAEFDCVSGNTTIASKAIEHAKHLVMPYLIRRAIEAGKPVDPYAVLSERLVQARLSPASIEDKANLLAQPLQGPHSYLLGYLAVKSMYVHLRKGFTSVRDPDFFLSGLILHFCADEMLARIALEDNDCDVRKLPSTLSALVDHLQDRWHDLHANLATRYKEAARDMQGDKVEDFTGFGVRIRDKFDEITVLTGLRTAALTAGGFTPSLPRYRQIVRFSGRRIWITARADLTAEIRRDRSGPVLLTCPMVPLADVGAYEGTIESICSDTGLTRAIVVLGHSGLVAVWDMATGRWNDPALVEDLDEMPPMSRIMDHGRDIAAAVQSRQSRMTEQGRELLNAADDVAYKGARFVYLQFMMPYFKPERRNSVGDALAEGLAGLFDEAKLLKVARLSIAFGGPGRTVAEASALLGEPEGAIEAEIADINARSQAKLGLDLMVREQGLVTSLF